MEFTRTVDENEINVGIALIIHKLRKLKKENDAMVGQENAREKAREMYEGVSVILKLMYETGLLTEDEMRKYSDEVMKGNKFPGVRPADFFFVINDTCKKELESIAA
jgi:hypothetical protein